MPYCCVRTCKNHSSKTNLSNSGISYHRFPSDPEVVAQWTLATGRKNWSHQKLSTICSNHFDEDSYLIGGKYRRLPDDAVPTMNLPDDEMETIDETVPKDSENSENYQDPTKQQLKHQLQNSQKLVKKQILLIKRLREQNRRDAKKITLQNKVLNDLMEIYNLKPGDIAILKTEIMNLEE